MSITQCPFCEVGSSFEAVSRTVAHYKQPLLFIQCTSCNKPVAVMDVYNLGVGLQNHNALLKKIVEKLDIRG